MYLLQPEGGAAHTNTHSHMFSRLEREYRVERRRPNNVPHQCLLYYLRTNIRVCLSLRSFVVVGSQCESDERIVEQIN